MRRPFREAPPAVRRLLAGNRQIVSRHPWLSAAERVTGLQPAAPSGASRDGGPSVRRGTAAQEDPSDLSGLVLEPLTTKEREVLGHLEELLTTEEMAEKMFVSVNTIRTHVRSILRKLGVNRRNAAVRRARELGLFDRRPPAP